jgi:hypothetical protein
MLPSISRSIAIREAEAYLEERCFQAGAWEKGKEKNGSVPSHDQSEIQALPSRLQCLTNSASRAMVLVRTSVALFIGSRHGNQATQKSILARTPATNEVSVRCL